MYDKQREQFIRSKSASEDKIKDPYADENTLKRYALAPGRAIQNKGNALKINAAVLSPEVDGPLGRFQKDIDELGSQYEKGLSAKTKNLAYRSGGSMADLSHLSASFHGGVAPERSVGYHAKRFVGGILANPVVAHSIAPLALAGAGYGAYRYANRNKQKSASILLKSGLSLGTGAGRAVALPVIGAMYGNQAYKDSDSTSARIGATLLGGLAGGAANIGASGVKNFGLARRSLAAVDLYPDGIKSMPPEMLHKIMSWKHVGAGAAIDLGSTGAFNHYYKKLKEKQKSKSAGYATSALIGSALGGLAGGGLTSYATRDDNGRVKNLRRNKIILGAVGGALLGGSGGLAVNHALNGRKAEKFMEELHEVNAQADRLLSSIKNSKKRSVITRSNILPDIADYPPAVKRL